MREKKKPKVKIKYAIILLIIALILVAISLARYVLERQDIRQIESTKFYFESDIATLDNKIYTIKWDGENSKDINFCIQNYLNKLEYTNEDIKYKISSVDINNTNKVNLKIYDSNDLQISDNTELTLTGGALRKNDYRLNISKKGTLNDGDEIDIKLKFNAISPYEKEITATIKVTVETEKEYESNLINYADYVIINIKTNKINNNIEINYDNTKLTLDKSSNLVNEQAILSNGTTNTIQIPKTSIEDNSNYEIVFIKTTSNATITLGTDIII